MTLPPDHQHPPIDYDRQREVAARLRAEMMNDVVSKGLSAIAPSRRTLRTVGLSILLAAGAFWAVMLKDPPATGAADPSASPKAFSPLDLDVASDLSISDSVEN